MDCTVEYSLMLLTSGNTDSTMYVRKLLSYRYLFSSLVLTESIKPAEKKSIFVCNTCQKEHGVTLVKFYKKR